MDTMHRIRRSSLALMPVLVTALLMTQGATAWAAAPSPMPTSRSCISPITSWTVPERLEQLMMVSGQFSNLRASAWPAASGVGGFVFFGQPPSGSGFALRSGLSSLAWDARSSGQVVPWFSTDEEGGYVARLSNVIGWLPTPRQMAARWTPAQVRGVMTTYGARMRWLGISMDLAPVVDTASPYNRIADESDRSFSANGWVAAGYGIAYASGLRNGGVVPVLKHFPGLGHASANTDLGPAVDPSLARLEANDLIPFERGISAGMPVIMVGHPSVPGLTGTRPASLSAATYSFLRNGLHFYGVALTDSLSAGAISAAGYSQSAAAARALEAGADMVMINVSAWRGTLATLERAVAIGALPVWLVNLHVQRIMAAKGLRPC